MNERFDITVHEARNGPDVPNGHASARDVRYARDGGATTRERTARGTATPHTGCVARGKERAVLLKEIHDKGHYAFTEGPLTWQDAIRECVKPLCADGTVDPVYADEIIACVEKHGPYIVLIPGVAMPHSTENAHGCNATAIGFMHCAQPVHFEEGNPEKDAQVFFTLCDTDPDAHLANMQRLYAVLSNDEAIARLKEAAGPEDLLVVDELVNEG